MAHFLAIIAFSIFDIVCSALTPYVSCLVAGVIANALELEKTGEVFLMVAFVIFISANLLEVLDIMFEKLTSPDSKTSSLYSSVLNVLSFLNLVWLVISVRALVRASASGPTLGSTPFGFFLASLLFTCCKFLVYVILYMINVTLRRTAEAGERAAETAAAVAKSTSNAKMDDKIKSVKSTDVAVTRGRTLTVQTIK